MKNAKKYGTQKNDVIAQMFAISYDYGSGFCKGNIIKYITRYDKVAKMGLYERLKHKLSGKGTKKDLEKANDYTERWINASHYKRNRTEIEVWFKNISK